MFSSSNSKIFVLERLATTAQSRICIVDFPTERLIASGLELLDEFSFVRARPENFSVMDLSAFELVVFSRPPSPMFRLPPRSSTSPAVVVLAERATSDECERFIGQGFDGVIFGKYSSRELRESFFHWIRRGGNNHASFGLYDEARFSRELADEGDSMTHRNQWPTARRRG